MKYITRVTPRRVLPLLSSRVLNLALYRRVWVVARSVSYVMTEGVEDAAQVTGSTFELLKYERQTGCMGGFKARCCGFAGRSLGGRFGVGRGAGHFGGRDEAGWPPHPRWARSSPQTGHHALNRAVLFCTTAVVYFEYPRVGVPGCAVK